MKLSELKPNPDNPRVIKDGKFEKLCKSITDFPKMLELRPIVVDENKMILGGNMRLRALQHLGFKDIPETWVKKASELTEEEKKRFVISDNANFGEWNWDDLANEWDYEKLDEWGVDVPKSIDLNENDLFNIEIPFYTPSKIEPRIEELADLTKAKELINKIEGLNLPDELKNVLIARAYFFTDFNFDKLADYFCKSESNLQEIMKDLGMVVIAPKEALNRGFVELYEHIMEI